MKVNANNRDISFNGFLKNKALKKGLEFAAENGALFAATTTLVCSSTLRPVAILATPNTDKRNKEVACAKSITSTLNGYLITLLLSRPLSRSIKKIDVNPEKYLNKSSIKNLQENAKTLTDSNAYKMATQLFKLGLGAVIAAPKAILTAIGTPYILKFFDYDDKNNLELLSENKNEAISFKGKANLSKGIANVLNKEGLQSFVSKYKDSNFPMHIVAMTDSIATAGFVYQTSKNKKLSEKEKSPLIANSIISTLLSIISTYCIDAGSKNATQKFIEKYKLANITDKNLNKQIEGIKIAKPILIAATMYYLIIPVISTFLADRVNLGAKKI